MTHLNLWNDPDRQISYPATGQTTTRPSVDGCRSNLSRQAMAREKRYALSGVYYVSRRNDQTNEAAERWERCPAEEGRSQI